MGIQIDKLTENLNIHQSLPDQPSLSAQDLKKEWDKPANIIKDYINNILVEGINKSLSNELDNIKEKILEEAFPIGTTVVFNDSADHSNHMGFKWERQYEGRTPIGYKEGDADFGEVGKTGGSKTVTLTTANLPPHKHTYQKATATTRNDFDRTFSSTGVTSVSSASATTESTGSGTAVNIMNPYEVVAYWKRIS